MKKIIKKTEYVPDNECQEIILDDGTMIAITDEFICVYDNECQEDATIVIERKSISSTGDNKVYY